MGLSNSRVNQSVRALLDRSNSMNEGSLLEAVGKG